jgi:dihydroorotase-like cyclic amidohydrolase
MSELLKSKENTELLNNLNWKFAMYSEVYSPKDELEIFQELFDYAILNNKKIHIIWITLKEELDILEKYYTESWYLREDVNCFVVDFAKTLVTVSVCIENLIWRWSDYKSNWRKIFFVPPIRESGQNKAMFKGINKWSIAGIQIPKKEKQVDEIINFLQTCVKEENILPLTLWKVLKYNLEEIWFNGKIEKLEIKY